MNRITGRPASVLLLTLVGFVSALVAIVTEQLLGAEAAVRDWAFGYHQGFVFGVMIAVYFVTCERVRSVTKAVAFIASCTAAYLASILVLPLGMVAWQLVQRVAGLDPESGDFSVHSPALFVSGWLGAAIVFLAALLLFGKQPFEARSFGRVVLSALIGGVLGSLGWQAGVWLGPSLYPLVAGWHLTSDPTYEDAVAHQSLQLLTLPIIWQSGVALSLGLLLRREGGIVPAAQAVERQHDYTGRRWTASRVAAIVFFCGVFAFLLANIRGTMWRAQTMASIDAEIKRSVDEAPSDQNLPPIQPLKAEQALVLEDLGGFSVRSPSMNFYPGQPGKSGTVAPVPPTVVYGVLYETNNDAPSWARGQSVGVEVTQYPNPEWARYKVKYPSDPGFTRARSTTIAILGNKIVRDTSNTWLFCRWPSNTIVVTVRFYEPPSENEEILKHYLTRHPSSL